MYNNVDVSYKITNFFPGNQTVNTLNATWVTGDPRTKISRNT